VYCSSSVAAAACSAWFSALERAELPEDVRCSSARIAARFTPRTSITGSRRPKDAAGATVGAEAMVKA
jgi:hypothetical protein